MLKICFIASTYPRYPGDSTARFILSMAEALARQGHEVHVLVPYHPAIRPLPGPVLVHTFRYIWPDRWSMMGYAGAMDSDRKLRAPAYFLSPIYLASGLLRLRQLSSRIEFDVIHAHWVIPNGPIGASIAWKRSIPFFISLHGSDVFVARNNGFLGRLANACFKQAHTVTACSPHLRDGALELGADPTHSHVVPYGVDPEVFEQSEPSSIGELKRKLGVRHDAVVVLSLGRLVKKKGIEYLLQSVPMIHGKHPEAVFVIAGDGPELNPLRQLCTSLGVEEVVRFVGDVRWQDVPNYLHASDIFVVPSIRDDMGNVDGLPNTILEAMAAGRPVIASNLAGIPLVVHDGETGLLVAERESAALAAAISSLISKPERRLALGDAAQQLVKSELTWDDVAETLATYYEDALISQ